MSGRKIIEGLKEAIEYAQTNERFVCLDGTPAKRAASDAKVEAMADRLCRVLGALVDDDVRYNDRDLVIRCASHGEAMHKIFEARSALALARVALGENGDEARG